MPSPIRVVFMGTPDFAVPTLEALISHPEFDVELIVSQPDKPKGRGKKLAPTPVKKVALDHGIPTLQPARAKDEENIAKLNEIAPDYIVVVAYGQILPVALLNIPKIAPVNLHASLLPLWRGAAPIHRSFLAGDTVTGVCAMLMEKGLDTGDVLACRETEITDDDTVGRVHDRLAKIGAVLMAETLIDFRDGKIEPVKQDDSKATYADKLIKEDFIIDWGQTADEVSRRIRGLSPYPGAKAIHEGNGVKLLFAKVSRGIVKRSSGEVIAVSKGGIEIACGEGSILVTEVKPEGKGVMTAHAYSLGRKINVGGKFD